MNRETQIDVGTLATITVSWNPDMDLLAAQIRSLPAASRKIIVDNASSQDTVTRIEALIPQVPNSVLLRNRTNVGLAAAINQGVKHVSELTPTARFVLLLDQDSTPLPGSVEALIGAFETLDMGGKNVGCVGPLLRDPDIGLTHGFHQCTGWRWKRIYPVTGSTIPVQCANLNGSGTLTPISLFLHLGGLDESLFIDHVDTEWSFRVLASGYTLWGIPNAVFDHRMGQASLRLWWFGWRVWPSRSPGRHYYLFRNSLILMRRDYVPKVWKLWAIIKLLLIASVHALCAKQRRDQLRQMWRGVRAASIQGGQ